MKRVVPILDVAFAAAGVLAVLAMGGSWSVLFTIAGTAAAVAFLIRRRSLLRIRHGRAVITDRRRTPPNI